MTGGDIHVMAADPSRPGVLYMTTGFGRYPDDPQPREERRGHPGAVLVEELGEVEVGAHRDDQLGALLVGEQHRHVLTGADRGDHDRLHPEPAQPLKKAIASNARQAATVVRRLLPFAGSLIFL